MTYLGGRKNFGEVGGPSSISFLFFHIAANENVIHGKQLVTMRERHSDYSHYLCRQQSFTIKTCNENEKTAIPDSDVGFAGMFSIQRQKSRADHRGWSGARCSCLQRRRVRIPWHSLCSTAHWRPALEGATARSSLGGRSPLRQVRSSGLSSRTLSRLLCFRVGLRRRSTL